MQRKRHLLKAAGFFAAMLLWTAAFPPLSAAAAAPDIQAQTAILIDIDTGQILLEKGMDQKMYPASLTKIMTALIATEEGDPQEVITMSREAVFSLPYGCSHIALTDGEQLTLLDALYATMLPSANDAANGVAEHLSGSIEAFAERMNQRAAALGATNTHFVNPSGLPDPNHYTTARDLALITMQALRQPLFTQIWGTVQYTMGPTNKQDKERYFWNQTGLLVNNGYNYAYCTGGKLGWTEEAKHTLAAVAEKDGRRLLCILMKNTVMAENFKEAARLFEYGFNSFTSYTVAEDQLEQPAPVPIYHNGREVGRMLFQARPLTLLLADGVLLHEITPAYQLPDKVELGQTPTATVTYTLPSHVQGQFSTVGVQSLLVTGQEIFPANQPQDGGDTALPPRYYPKAEIDAPIWTMIAMVLGFGVYSVLLSLKNQTSRPARQRR